MVIFRRGAPRREMLVFSPRRSAPRNTIVFSPRRSAPRNNVLPPAGSAPCNIAFFAAALRAAHITKNIVVESIAIRVGFYLAGLIRVRASHAALRNSK